MSSNNLNIAVEALSVSKDFKLYSNPGDRFLEFLFPSKSRHKTFSALDNINFTLQKGESIGIIGRNGAGKSTLLQLICGTLYPSKGTVKIKGRIAALLELGAGFNPEFTGRENIWMNAAILGMSHDEIKSKFDEIVAFSEIEYAIDNPVKTYSSGMFLRLAFSVAVHVSPDILVIDEALSVGDGAFAKKSFDKIMQLKAEGCTLLFCSHALYQIEALCQKAIWIKSGKIECIGETKDVTSAYQSWLDLESVKSEGNAPKHPLQVSPESTDSPRILNITLLKNGKETNKLEKDITVFNNNLDTLELVSKIKFSSKAPAPTLGFVIETPAGVQVCSFISHVDSITIPKTAEEIHLKIPNLPLLKGVYSIDAFLLCEKGIHVYEHLRRVAEFQVKQTHLEVGLVQLAHHWELHINNETLN
ncbi:ABC transporter ATP-binding protein [Thiosulfativibrio zosterae]|uniref:Teichoic acid ABC transporter ATP-binding protein n=1 Tax=Thiosulfativibrio zosterae TaxID=2675053 RepID=A0A6F8PQK0_9GAMM|nr:ABC transporter ATP-binding protein [Thiosulfativibrio zosterae]BBP44307.1 teichoic acid ABC transporter ATP-binding protein [Thiosulfativibrio zosterae]